MLNRQVLFSQEKFISWKSAMQEDITHTQLSVRNVSNISTENTIPVTFRLILLLAMELRPVSDQLHFSGTKCRAERRSEKVKRERRGSTESSARLGAGNYKDGDR